MRVLAVLHRPTSDPAGAEKMVGGMLEFLRTGGHTTSELLTRGDTRCSDAELYEAVREADIVLTHLDATDRAMMAVSAVRKPLVVVEHNTFATHKMVAARSKQVSGLIFNSEWMRRNWSSSLPHAVVHPPVDPADYTAESSREAAACVNLYKNGAFFWQVAALAPDIPFLAVRGGYGKQTVPPVIPPNVTVLETTSDPARDIYSRAAVMLMPSKYESWGRVGVEAACSGIPTVASPTEGLTEALSYAGVFRPLDSPHSWAEAIRVVFEDRTTASVLSDLARRRAYQVWETTQHQLVEMETLLERLSD